MKQNLKKIYQDLSSGKLSQKDALEKIRALKLQKQDGSVGTLLIAPVWEPEAIAAQSKQDQFEYTQRHIVLCELLNVNTKQVEASIPSSHCLSIQTSVQKNIAERFCDVALNCFELIKKTLNSRPSGKVLVQVVIASNQEVTLLAGLSGLLKTAALENPQITGQIILTMPNISGEELVIRLQADKTRHQDKIIKYENGTRNVLRLQEVHASREAPKIVFKDHGVYLITGGLGGLGVLFAKEIIKQTSKAAVILADRSELTSDRKKILEALSAKSNLVIYRQLDIANLDQVKQLVTSIKKENNQLNGIIHCAGVNLDNFILKKTAAEFSKVLTPKVNGTFNIDQASSDIDLDFMVLFSSVASWLGNSGQADYATANSFMDQFAAYRNSLVELKKRKGKTLSINWPLWKEGGMKMDQASEEMLAGITGLHTLQTSTGIFNFYRSLELPNGQIMVMDGDYAQMRRGLFENQTNQQEELPVIKTPAAGIDLTSLFEKTQDFICKQLAVQLKIASHQLDSQAPLEKYGIDSILSLNLTNQLEKTFGSLPKTLFFEYQTIHELTGYFIKSYPDTLTSLFTKKDNSHRWLQPSDTVSKSIHQIQTRQISGGRFIRQRHETVSTKTNNTNNTNDPIAIIGLSGRYPEAKNIQEYWQNLRDGKDCIIEVPKERWDWHEYYTEDRSKNGYHYSKWGGFISGVDEFDPRFFNISPREAEFIDPQERLFLQHAWMAVEDAGYTRAGLQLPQENDLAGQVGVYVGVMYGEYQMFGAQANAQGKRIGLVNSYSSIANRVSYVLNLHGPSMTLDTMCSSSLTAIHIACQDLKLGRTNLAIAGGVNVSIHPNKYLFLSAGQFISTDGHCQSFGEGGDGYIPGEGVGAVLLKRLSDAIHDGNHIYGVIKGSSLNHGGKTNGYSVPNPQAQAGVISRALAESGINPRHISYIEAHGTGTKLGDPIEIAALSKAFSQFTQDTQFCLIGSAKSNIGHCESAAGIAGITKILLQIKHQKIVPSLHSGVLNPYIDFPKTPFIVNQKLRAWDQPVVDGQQLPRIAGISSFGAGGSNAHIIIQEYVSQETEIQPVAVTETNTNFIISLSARTEDQLKQKVRDLSDFIHTAEQDRQSEGKSKPVDLSAMAYTLQVGREAMDERLGFIVSSVSQLTDKLQAYLNDKQDVEDTYHGQVKRNKETLSLFNNDSDLQQTIEKWIADKKLSKLLELWVKGLELDWNKLYDDVKPQRISLPAYPFAKERYWIDITEGETVTATGMTNEVLHPLLHTNTSDIIQQSYSSVFNGKEFFFENSQISGQKILKTSVYMEMARAAVENALPVEQKSMILELHNVVFGQPFVFTENKKVSIALFAKNSEQIDYEIYSQNVEEEVVHYQGQAIISRQTAPAKLDIDQLRRQNGQGSQWLLTEIELPAALQNSQSDFILHPGVIDSVLNASVNWIQELTLFSKKQYALFALESICIISACSKEMAIWVRLAKDSKFEDNVAKLDIDLCDQLGNICIRIRGLSYKQESMSEVTKISEQTVVHVKPAEPKHIPIAFKSLGKTSIGIPELQTFGQTETKKTRSISLVAPGELVSEKIDNNSLSKPSIIFSNSTFESSVPESKADTSPSVSLYDYGNGIFSILINAAEGNNTLSENMIEQLLQTIDTVQRNDAVKVLILNGLKHTFLCGGRSLYNAAVEKKLFQAIASFPYPVIAAMQGDAIGAGFLVGALCDLMICSEEGKYYYTNQQDFYPSDKEDILFKERFGDVCATDFLYMSNASNGSQLKAKGWNCPIIPQDKVEAYAQTVAQNLAKKSQASLRLLKRHLGRHINDYVNKLTTVNPLVLGSESNIAAKSNKTTISPVKNLQLEVHAEDILVIRMNGVEKSQGLKTIVSDLNTVFASVNTTSQYKTIVLVIPNALHVTGKQISSETVLDFQRAVFELAIPVIAALDSNAKGVALLMSQFCDACIYSETGSYSVDNILQYPELTRQAAMIFSNKFGNHIGKEILLTGKEYSGLELQQRNGFLNIAKKDLVLPSALQLAESWAKLPLDTLLSWKKQMVLSIREKLTKLPAWLESKNETTKAPGNVPTSVALVSKVISATSHPEGILVVKMEDREARNMFSDALVEGIVEVFKHIKETPVYKVLIITGFDNYFASGGTKETLLDIQKGKIKFTDIKIFHLAMECSVPVIAAMQGHGIGAGWSLGMFADFNLFSEESKYVSPYMNYGFTPGAGATLIFPEKVGYDLAREMLLTAQEYTGSELKSRGIMMQVLPREKVLADAMDLARHIANGSRNSLIALKHQSTQHILKRVEENYQLELDMHEKTFVGQSETLQMIQDNFGGGQRRVEKSHIENSTQSATLASSSGSDNLSGIKAIINNLLAQELHLQEGEIDENTQFVDLGLDSITGVTWVRKINDKYKTSIEATKIYSFPTLAQFSRFVKDEAEKLGTLGKRADEAETTRYVPQINVPSVSQNRIDFGFASKKLTSLRKKQSSRIASASPSIKQSQPIAVIGMAGQFPQAKNIDEFWNNIAQGKTCISHIPETRWDINTYFSDGSPMPGKTNCKWLGALEEYDLFDPLFFNISPTEAESMDPQQRVLLQACWHSIENAGYNPKALSGSKCGVYIGCAGGDYHLLSRELQISAQGFTGGATSILAARISYLLNLQGPCLSIDTACSSSLVAIATACDSLIAGNSDLALAGGVYVMVGPEMHIKSSQTGMLSPDGRCYTFDNRANGFVPGEGVGVMILKRLSDAERDNDIIYGVIQGWGVNQDGKTNGITAPNEESQTRLEQEVYDKFQIDPNSIQLIEAHGTGTKLGDPIEVAALKKAFQKYTQKREYCALGSVKSNIGHCLTAAGISSTIKVLLALKNKQLPPTVNFEKLNEHISLKDSPFYVNDKLQEWKISETQRRQAAISSFGFGGTNAHLVVAEYLPSHVVKEPVSVITQNAKIIIPLSARTEDQLKQKTRDLVAYIRNSEQSIDLVEMAYTLQVGREAMGERLCFMISSMEQLAEKLQAYVDGEKDIQDMYRGQVRRNKEGLSIINHDDDLKKTIIDTWINQKKLSNLIDLWVKGMELDWNKLYGEVKPRRMALPIYPFAKEQYWINTEETALVAKAGNTIAFLHPLLHANTSDLFQQSYSSTFSGKEFFLKDYQVQTNGHTGQKVLPAVAYLEMARAAVERAMPNSQESPTLELHNIEWQQPALFSANKEVTIVLFANENEQINYKVYSIEDEQETVHCKGQAVLSRQLVKVKLDITQIKRKLAQGIIEPNSIYAAFSKLSGLPYGSAYQGIQSVLRGESELLAQLRLPEVVETSLAEYMLHPSLMDSALQACIGLIGDSNQLSSPLAIDSLYIISSCTKEMYAWIRYSSDSQLNSKFNKLDIDLCDQFGNVCVQIKGFSTRIPEGAGQSVSQKTLSYTGNEDIKAGLQSLIPVWNPINHEQNKKVILSKSAKILLIGNDLTHLEWVHKPFPNAYLIQLPLVATIDDIQAKLKDCSFDQMLWIAPDAIQTDSNLAKDNEQIVYKQEQGVLSLFLIVKALLQLEYAEKELQWTVITRKTQRVKRSEQINPTHAGIFGLIGSLAKEYPHWNIRLIDVDSLESVAAHECLSLAWDKDGNGLACRQGEWFYQGLTRMTALPQHTTPIYKQKGVYVIIGGAGGLGEVWSRFMIERYQAKIVWIGRKELNATIEKKISSLSQLGDAPLYISADATKLKDLRQASKKILDTYPVINGVVHSALILKDQSINQMSESTFRSSLSAKVDISVNMDLVFGNQNLDFMLFFSSIISFTKSQGQSNYAAGCTFKDSFAQSLQQKYPYPVKIMNWGYWGNVGIVADEFYNKRMLQEGIGSIEPQEAMESLQTFVSSDIDQIALLKTINTQIIDEISLPEKVTYYPKVKSSVLPKVQAALTRQDSDQQLASLEDGYTNTTMDVLVTEILASSLISLGLFNKGLSKLADLPLDKQPASFYERWLSTSIQYLQEQQLLSQDLNFNREVKKLEVLWGDWETNKSKWFSDPHQKAQVVLLETCLKALPSILSAKKLATDVIFPNSSMALVESVYKGNKWVDYFNQVLGETLKACIKQKLQIDKESKVRILEIGAGTGGTTSKLLPLLQEFSSAVTEYCYTDLSKAFLMHAEEHYQPQFPSLTTARFDISEPLASQSIATDYYDIVIAANVLHATPNIRETLRNAKAVLTNQGVLLLNEISNWTLFNHLTFGLLEGWWLYKDIGLRIPGSAGLTPEKWEEVLSEEGFEPVFFSARNAHKFGQQIIAASSDGCVRQRVVNKLPSQLVVNLNHSNKKAKDIPVIKNNQTLNESFSSPNVTEEMKHDHIRRIIIDKVSKALKIEPNTISNDESFADYGLDSIIGVNLVRNINEALQIKLETTTLFDYSSVNKLTQHILSTWEVKISEQLNQTENIITEQIQLPGETIHSVKVMPNYRFSKKAISSKENSTRVGRHDSIAIIGMSGRFSESETLDEFWQNLKDGKDLVKEVTRWPVTDCITPDSTGNGYCTHGSFIDSIDQFDPLFFRISPLEARYMDPQQRLFLEECWKALEDAGYAGKSMDEKLCGVYVGSNGADYEDTFEGDRPGQAFWGNSRAVIPARIAYYLNLHGPTVTIDTACSSSLVSIHLACQGLWSGEMEMALAGGVLIQSTPGFYQLSNRAGMLSSKGKCFTFDNRADGFVPGEGVGVILLKRLDDALRDGDSIHGVIVGTGINQDGKTNGITAPSAKSQERLESSVYERFNINPETIQLVEAHGTGTILGDPIEYGALSRSFRKFTDKKQFCAIGSVKTNIGHCASAAGIAGVLKVLLSLKHKQIPQSLHFQEGNHHIDFESSPFFVNTKLIEWNVEPKQRRRSAVSAFGFSGTNAHMIIEEAPLLEKCDIKRPGYLVVLSALSSEQLKQQVQNFLLFAKRSPEISMNSLSFTLFVGRMHQSHRLSCVVRSQEEMIHLFKQWLETGNVNQIYTSEIQERNVQELPASKKHGNQCIEACRNLTNVEQYLENLTTVANLYIQGYSLNFHLLFPENSRRISLPTYPFAKEKYWVENTASNQSSENYNMPKIAQNLESMEDIIDKIDNGSIDINQAVKILKNATLA